MRRALSLLPAAAALLAGCSGDGAPSPSATAAPARTETATPRERPPARPTPYEPPAGEPYGNGKRLAGRVAQRIMTYERGATAREIAQEVSADGGAVTADTIAPAVVAGTRSTGRVVYAQLSGVTRSSLGAMVLVRQQLETATRSRSVTRVVDVRLRRSGGPWSLASVASVGGTPAPRLRPLPRSARRVLDHPRVSLSDTARWDIHRNLIDDALLKALADAADRQPISVAVLRTGHPENVWATKRRSAHRAGLAADIYAVGGRRVVLQRTPGSPAHRLATSLLAGDAAQIGSPWMLAPGVPRSFSDAVHQDHIHLKQRNGGAP